MKKKKIVSLSLIVALIAIIAGGTYAYFTDNTETATNTFTVGNVDIELTESETKNGGREVVTEDRLVDENFTGNEYHLVPGAKYIKNPKVWVKENSEPSYVFIKIENQLNDFVKTQLESQMVDNGWEKVERVILPDGEMAENVWGYKDIVETSDKEIPLPIFSEFTIDPNADRDKLVGNEKKNIVINAFAIQSEAVEKGQAGQLAVEHFFK